MVSGVLDDILAAIQSPERPKSPVDAYITEEETFNRKNPTVSGEHIRLCLVPIYLVFYIRIIYLYMK